MEMNAPSQSAVGSAPPTASSAAPPHAPLVPRHALAPALAAPPVKPTAAQASVPSTTSSSTATTPQQVAAAAAALAASRAASVSAAMRSVFGAKHAPAAQSLKATGPVASATTPKTISAAKSSSSTSVVMQSTFDGLPELPSLAAGCVDIPWTTDDSVPVDGAVSLYGEPCTRSAIRASLVQFYASSSQLPTRSSESEITEMTLRMDTELEMLRRQCFAERNARWHNHTPDMFSFAPIVDAPWVPAPYMGARKKTLLVRKRHEHQRLRHEHHDKLVESALESDALLKSLIGVEFVRDRPWPPKEFTVKNNHKPSRGGSGAFSASGSGGNRMSAQKKKALGMTSVVDETPTHSIVCSECQTQSSALWRKRPRAQAPSVEGAPVEEEDVCMACYLKTQRGDIFEKKAAEKTRRIKEEAARVAQEARQLKKQQQQMQKKLKKLAAQQQQQVKSEPEDYEPQNEEPSDSSTPTAAPALKLEESGVLRFKIRSESAGGGAEFVVEKEKKREKKSKKDKKKKKKKKKKKAQSSDWDDSESDDDGAASSVILPSPPQRQMDGFVYADRTAEPTPNEEVPVLKLEPVGDADSSSKSKKASASKRQSGASTSASRSSSKKRKSSDTIADVAAPVPSTVSPSTPVSSLSRSSRARSSSVATTPAPVPAPVPAATTPSARKRQRPTKKETARERELRALGQYCPVCNMTYEEDDASPFVCCDSCEMWVHAACDATLTPEKLATLGDSNEKYICPLCGGR